MLPLSSYGVLCLFADMPLGPMPNQSKTFRVRYVFRSLVAVHSIVWLFAVVDVDDDDDGVRDDKKQRCQRHK